MLYLPSRFQYSQIDCGKVRTRLVAILFLTLVFAWRVKAQGVETPPVTSFQPDTSLPKVNVPEFVITGKAQIELPRADKPSVEIDSSYFQGKQLEGVGVNVPLNRSLSSQGSQNSGDERPNLFARTSIGHYTTTEYLLSGGGGYKGYDMNGSVSGDYTSGFIANTIQRSILLQGGVAKDFDIEQVGKLSNSLNLGYARSSYFLYGGQQPILLRKVNQFSAGINSNIEFGETPLAVELGFDRFSTEDWWDVVQSSLKLHLHTQFSLPSGNLGISGVFRAGNHTINSIPIVNPALPPLERSLYDLRAGANYSNSFGDVSYSVALNYFQYKDDSSSGIAKLYPDLRANYKLNSDVSLFAGFYGTVDEANLLNFVSTDRYVDGWLALRNTQRYADFTLGSRVALSNELVVTPQFNIEALEYYPIFISTAINNSQLIYANKATVFSVSVAVKYTKENFSGDATLRFQTGTADSLTSIPNLPPVDLNFGAAYKFTPQFTLRGWFLFLSKRYSDLALTNELGAVGLLNLRLSYSTKVSTLPLEIFVEGKNLLNQKYFIWQGYQEFPLSLFIGVSSKIL